MFGQLDRGIETLTQGIVHLLPLPECLHSLAAARRGFEVSHGSGGLCKTRWAEPCFAAPTGDPSFTSFSAAPPCVAPVPPLK